MTRKSHLLARATALVLILVFALPQGFAQTGGSISGKVVDETGTALAGARVSYHNLVPHQRDARGSLRPIGTPISSGVQSSTTGEYQITGLAEGEYVLCAAGTGAAHVWSCLWDGATSGHVRLSPGQVVANKVLVVRTGTLLKLRVQDPAGRITAGARFIAGVLSNSGHYGRARITARTATEVEYTVVVPKGTSGRVFLDSTLTITTATGQPVDVRRPSLPFSAGQQDELTIVLVVL